MPEFHVVERGLEFSRNGVGGYWAKYACGCVAQARHLPPPDECQRCALDPFVKALTAAASLAAVVPVLQGTRRALDGLKQPVAELPLVFETKPIVGYRGFCLEMLERRGAPGELRLVSLTGRHVWEPKQRAEARCIMKNFRYNYRAPTPVDAAARFHEAPWVGCWCGFWAARNQEALGNDILEGHGEVRGEVFLWGRILEFEHGWRAQYAYPRSLQVAADAPPGTAERLAELYGVPTTSHKYG